MNTDTLTDWPTVCATCVYPGVHRPRRLDIGPTYRCVGCGMRFTVDFDATEAAPGVLHTHANPAA